MWSGPRNISTALMRSFGNRPDCHVTDEPLYAYYLEQTGLDHPGRAETLAGHDRDWQTVVHWLTGEVPGNRAVWYLKLMAHHMLPTVQRDWIFCLVNCFLIRPPREMLTSLLEFLPQPRVEDTGLPQQWELFERVRQQTGRVPPVIDGNDVLKDPQGVLGELCGQTGIPFLPEMLVWPPGRRDTDGAWADHWYAKVYRTTRFAPWKPKTGPLPAPVQPLLRECQDYYERLAEHRICI